MLSTGATTAGKVLCGKSEDGTESSTLKFRLWKMTINFTWSDETWYDSAQVPPSFDIHMDKADRANRKWHHVSDRLGGFHAKFSSSLPLVLTG